MRGRGGEKVNDCDSTSIMRAERIEQRGYFMSILAVAWLRNFYTRVHSDVVCDAL